MSSNLVLGHSVASTLHLTKPTLCPRVTTFGSQPVILRRRLTVAYGTIDHSLLAKTRDWIIGIRRHIILTPIFSKFGSHQNICKLESRTRMALVGSLSVPSVSFKYIYLTAAKALVAVVIVIGKPILRCRITGLSIAPHSKFPTAHNRA